MMVVSSRLYWIDLAKIINQFKELSLSWRFWRLKPPCNLIQWQMRWHRTNRDAIPERQMINWATCLFLLIIHKNMSTPLMFSQSLHIGKRPNHSTLLLSMTGEAYNLRRVLDPVYPSPESSILESRIVYIGAQRQEWLRCVERFVTQWDLNGADSGEQDLFQCCLSQVYRCHNAEKGRKKQTRRVQYKQISAVRASVGPERCSKAS